MPCLKVLRIAGIRDKDIQEVVNHTYRIDNDKFVKPCYFTTNVQKIVRLRLLTLFRGGGALKDSISVGGSFRPPFRSRKPRTVATSGV